MQSKHEEISESRNTIFYWKGILDPQGLASVHKDTLKNLMEGNYHGLNFEKLVGHNVYSIRINDADRLLFTTINVQGKPYLMLLDEVLNHDYAKSRFLKPGVLKNYLELHGKAIAEELLSSHFESCSQDTIPLSGVKFSTNPIEYSRIDFHNQKFIVLDETQLEVATKKTFPLIISGAPGSGKSCIALLILGQYVELNTYDDYPVLYVTESKRLAKNMSHLWHALPIAQNLAADAVQFKSYQQLVTTLCPETANKIFVSKEHCKKWLIDYIKDKCMRDRATRKTTLSKGFFNDTEAMLQEFRIISGCLIKDVYLAHGKRQSFFHADAEKEWLFDAYTDYQKQLELDGCLHAPFYPLNLKDLYKLIVVDEAQDLSLLQLRSLSNLASNRQICFCEDNRQSLSDNKSKIPFLKGLMHAWSMSPDNHTTLSASYRCPEEVIRQVNAVSVLSSKVTGYGQSEIVVPEGPAKKGTVTWLSSPSELGLVLEDVAESPDYAIITLTKHKGEALELFNNPLVFTPDEIKGLEYENILAYRLFDDDLFRDVNKLVGEQVSDFSKKPGNRAKNNEGNEHYGPLINAIFTAFTRATGNLYVIQEKHTYLANIWDVLSLKALPLRQIKLETVSERHNQNNTQRWLDEVRMQLMQGRDDTAKNIYLKKLDKSAAEFKEFKSYFLQSEPPVNPVKVVAIQPTIEPRAVHTVRPVKNNAPKPRLVSTTPVSTSNTNVIHSSNNNSGNSDHAEGLKKINVLLKQITTNNLLKFLKDPKAKDYLYNIPLKKGVCLLTMLCCNDSVRDELFCFLSKNPKFQEKGITSDHLHEVISGYMPTLYSFLLTFNGRKILHKLCTNNKELAKSLYFDSMCIIAAERGDVAVISEVIKYKTDLSHIVDDENGTLAFIAATNGHANIIVALAIHDKNLLDMGIKNGATPAYVAAQNGELSVIKELIKYKANLNACTYNGATPLFVAAQNGHCLIVSILAKHGVELNTRFKNTDTPIYTAAYYGHVSVVEVLIQYQVDLDIPGQLGVTPACAAASQGYASIVTVLGMNGANINKSAENGLTPACVAAQNNYANVIEALITLKADFTLCYTESAEILRQCVSLRGKEIIERMEHFILNQQATSKEPNFISLAPYDIAYILGHEDVIKLLLPYKKIEDKLAREASRSNLALVNTMFGRSIVQDNRIIAKLSECIAEGHIDMAVKLMKLRPDLSNIIKMHLERALHKFASLGEQDTVEIILTLYSEFFFTDAPIKDISMPNYF